jgi:hypothetical protein
VASTSRSEHIKVKRTKKVLLRCSTINAQDVSLPSFESSKSQRKKEVSRISYLTFYTPQYGALPIFKQTTKLQLYKAGKNGRITTHPAKKEPVEIHIEFGNR